jgi:hypothetical protein
MSHAINADSRILQRHDSETQDGVFEKFSKVTDSSGRDMTYLYLIGDMTHQKSEP